MRFARSVHLILCISVSLLLCGAALCAAPTQSLIIPVTLESGVWSQVLDSGVHYEFVVSGVAGNLNGQASFDAEWQTDGTGTGWMEYDQTPPGEWGQSRDILDLFINDKGVDWLGSADLVTWSAHTYSPYHVYKFYFDGTGQAVKFHIADPTPIVSNIGKQPWYRDNSGYLSVTIATAPEPGGVLALATGICSLCGMLWRARRQR